MIKTLKSKLGHRRRSNSEVEDTLILLLSLISDKEGSTPPGEYSTVKEKKDDGLKKKKWISRGRRK